MATDDTGRRSRRAVLASAAAGAAALAAARIAEPAATSAANGDPLLVGQENFASAPTFLTTQTGFRVANVSGLSSGIGLQAFSSGIGVYAREGSDQFDPYGSGFLNVHHGVYAFTGTPGGTALYAQPAINGGTIGILSSGDVGGRMLGQSGGLAGWGFAADAFGVHGHVSSDGSDDMPAHATNTALYGTVDDRGHKYGLQVQGKVRLVDRSGRVTVAAGKASVSRSVAGVTSSNVAVATLNANRSGNGVRAVVCSADKITIHLWKAVGRKTAVSWIVLG